MKGYLLLLTIFLSFQTSYSQSGPVKKGAVPEKPGTKKSSQELKSIMFNGPDGPHIIKDTLYRVKAQNQFVIEDEFNSDSLLVQVNNKASDQFTFSLQSDYQIPKSTYTLPNKMVVIADIEGNFNAFSSFLMTNKIIDENHNWIFDEGHLVLVGDFVDRGKNVTQILWLIYKLEQQSIVDGGQVHFILGNHEVLNFQGDHRYNSGKYIKVAQEISGEKDKKKAIKYMYSDRSELGRWLATKNVIEKIGSYLFVHAGLSPEILDYDLTLDEINSKVRLGFRDENSLKNDKTMQFLYSSKGPFWYRGLVYANSKHDKIETEQLENILTQYSSKKIVIGHTVVKDVTSAFDCRVIMVDVSHGIAKYSGKTKGLLIESETEYVISDTGLKKALE